MRAIATLVLALALASPAAAGEAALRPDPGGRLVADAEVDGRRVRVVVAPDSPHVLVPTATAERIGVAFDRRAGRRETVLGRDILAFPVVLGEVRIGAAVVSEVPALVVDDRRVREVSLGRPFLARADGVSWRDGRLTVRSR